MEFEFSSFQNVLAPQNQNNGVVARFYDKYVQTEKFAQNGLPVFEKKLYVEIKVKDQYDVFDQPATEDHVKRFEVQYQNYLQSLKQEKKGTPLSMFAFLNAEQIACCRFRNIFTVEALAQLDEANARALNLENEKDLALDFLRISKNNKALFEMKKKQKEYLAEIENLKQEIERLKNK